MSKDGEPNKEGFVLVSVLAVVLVFVAISATLVLRSRLFVVEARNHLENVRLQAVVDGIARQAALSLAQDRFPLPATGDVGICSKNAARVTVSAIDQDMLLDLNGATPQMMEDVLGVIGIGETESKTIAAQVVDYRDPDDLTQPLYGAERTEYQRAGLSWTPRNDYFADAEEVAQLPVVTQDLFGKITPYLTTYNPRAAIDPALIYSRFGHSAEIMAKLSKWVVASRRLRFAVRVEGRIEGRAAATRLAIFAVSDTNKAPVFLKWSRYEAASAAKSEAEKGKPLSQICTWTDAAGASTLTGASHQ